MDQAEQAVSKVLKVQVEQVVFKVHKVVLAPTDRAVRAVFKAHKVLRAQVE
jgi:hypothetical protein